MDHKEALTDAKVKKYQKISDLIRHTWNFSDDFTHEEVTKVLGILSVNSFCVHDGDEEGTGLTGLYPWTSLLSHSCRPNIKIVTKPDFSYICSAVIDIGQGSEIVTSYHHYYYHLYGTNNRREHIRNNWKFDCTCSRCEVRVRPVGKPLEIIKYLKDPTEFGTFVNGVLCCLCRTGTSLPIEPLNYSSAWRCLDCQGTQPAGVITARIKAIEADLDSLPDSRPEKLEKMLRELESKLHGNHYLITDTKRRIIDIYGHQGGHQYNQLGRISKLKQVIRASRKILHFNYTLINWFEI